MITYSTSAPSTPDALDCGADGDAPSSVAGFDESAAAKPPEGRADGGDDDRARLSATGGLAERYVRLPRSRYLPRGSAVPWPAARSADAPPVRLDSLILAVLVCGVVAGTSSAGAGTGSPRTPSLCASTSTARSSSRSTASAALRASEPFCRRRARLRRPSRHSRTMATQGLLPPLVRGRRTLSGGALSTTTAQTAIARGTSERTCSGCRRISMRSRPSRLAGSPDHRKILSTATSASSACRPFTRRGARRLPRARRDDRDRGLRLAHQISRLR